MKMSLAWHKQAAINWKATLERKRWEVEIAKAEYERSVTELALYEKQIAAAEAKHKDGFDDEKFMKLVR